MKKMLKNLFIWFIKKCSLEVRIASINKILNHKPKNNNVNSKVFGEFIDSCGKKHSLISGLRDQIKPGWRSMFIEKNFEKTISHESIVDELAVSKVQLERIQRLIGIHSINIKSDMDILEIGAANGATVFQIASYKPRTVMGSDMIEYQINQSIDANPDDLSIISEKQFIQSARNKMSTYFDKDISDIVSFIEDDICNSKISSDSKDLIFSWDTLEHLKDPESALYEMYRILKPGGYAFHEYNPFFSFNGGHSLCTLDFLWGHVRLSSEDFENYLKQIRPDEYETALKFYKKNLNRMTTRQLKKYISSVGFDPIIHYPNINYENYFAVSEGIFSDCKKNYPSLELIDLVSPSVWVGIRKPLMD